MQKIWFIKIQGQKEGPYSVEDLKRDFRITPDTPVWKEGFPDWVLIRYIPELKDVFADEEETKNEEAEESQDALKLKAKQTFDELAIDWRSEPPPVYLWVLIGLVLLVFTLYQLRSFFIIP